MTRPKRNTSGDPDSRPKKTPISPKRKQARCLPPTSSVHDESNMTEDLTEVANERAPSPTNSSSGSSSSCWSSEAPRSSSAGRCSGDRGSDDASSDTNTTPPSSPTPMKWRVPQRINHSPQFLLNGHGGGGGGGGGASDGGGKGGAPGAGNYHHRSEDEGADERDHEKAGDEEEEDQRCDETHGREHHGIPHPTVGGLCLRTTSISTSLPSILGATSIQSLPSEILLQIGELLFERDLNRFSRTNRRLYILLTHALYRMGKEIEFLDASTILHWGAGRGLTNTVAHLLEQGANPNSKFQRASHPLQSDGRTPLHIAAEKGHRRIAMLLLGKGAKTKVWDREGDTPLHLAVKNGNIKMVKLLVTAGAKITARNADGMRPLHMAIQEERRDIVKLLISMGADVAATDRTGGTALHLAASFYTAGICKRLIDAGAEVNAKDLAGMTPLHWAAYSGWESVARLLVRRGAKLEERDGDGYQPWQLAGVADNKAVLSYLDRFLSEDGQMMDAVRKVPRRKGARLPPTEIATAVPLPSEEAQDGDVSSEE